MCFVLVWGVVVFGLCMGDFRLVVIDLIGCGIMLFCCIDYENEDLDFILWVFYRFLCFFMGFIVNLYLEFERFVICYCNVVGFSNSRFCFIDVFLEGMCVNIGGKI